MSKTEPRKDDESARTKTDHPAGPHATPELTNEDATPGAGALPDPKAGSEDAGGTG